MITLKSKVTENEIEKKIWIHNVYNFSLTFYSSTNNISILSTIEKWINEIEMKYILLKIFNLHYSLWNESSKFTQHVMTNKLIDIIDKIDMTLTLSHKTITWKIKNFQSTIDLIFMFNELINKIKHCKAKLKINQSSDHSSMSTKFLLKMVTTSKRFCKTWISINIEKSKEMKK